MYYNEELQKTCPTGRQKYYKDGELIEFEFDNNDSKWDENLAKDYGRVYGILKAFVWDIEYGPGGSDDIIVKWKRDEDG